MNRCTIVVSAVTLLASAQAYAVPTMDGNLAGDTAFYGTALSTQPVKTQFGDAITGRSNQWRRRIGDRSGVWQSFQWPAVCFCFRQSGKQLQ